MYSLRKALFTAVEESISNEVSLAVAFSGGVDSALLAKLCKDLGKKVVLLTIGFPESHDIEFSKMIASKMDLSHKIHKLNEKYFCIDLNYVKTKIGCKNVSHIENCLAFFYIASLAIRNGLGLILTGNGCDELFCGYDRYRLIYQQGKTSINELMDQRIANELVLMQEIQMIATEIGVNIKQPFLSQKFISYARDIPIDQKIRGSDDFIRKHVLRETALLVGVPKDAAMKPKKAIQYGSLIHKKFNTLSKEEYKNRKKSNIEKHDDHTFDL
jgi:asparagine synthase (glutamine-hydrolysing)